jgi:hypothetical protein
MEGVYQHYGDRVALVGDVDMHLMAIGIEEVIQKRTRKLLDVCGREVCSGRRQFRRDLSAYKELPGDAGNGPALERSAFRLSSRKGDAPGSWEGCWQWAFGRCGYFL